MTTSILPSRSPRNRPNPPDVTFAMPALCRVFIRPTVPVFATDPCLLGVPFPPPPGRCSSCPRICAPGRVVSMVGAISVPADGRPVVNSPVGPRWWEVERPRPGGQFPPSLQFVGPVFREKEPPSVGRPPPSWAAGQRGKGQLGKRGTLKARRFRGLRRSYFHQRGGGLPDRALVLLVLG